jgi:DeoR/GlpR family transcriptional regulator of sugar metabolism
VANIDVMDTLVTDASFSKQAKKELGEYSVNVLVAA